MFIRFLVLLTSLLPIQYICAQPQTNPPTHSAEEAPPPLPSFETKPADGPRAALRKYLHVVDLKEGEEEQYTIQLTNDGTAPLIIDEVTSDCACITANWPQKAIEPTETVDIELTLRAAKPLGRQSHKVFFRTNATDDAAHHTVQVMVLPDGPNAILSLTERTIDFGVVEEGQLVTQVFTFTNTGEGPLLLMDAKGSCGCTVPQWPRDYIQAGETASITVEFNSKNKRGRRNQKVTITANTDPPQNFLYLTGEVIDSDKTIIEPNFDFPAQAEKEKVDPNCFVMFPNPTTELLQIDLDPTSGERADISLFSESGQLMAQRQVAISSETITFQVQHFPAGTYVAKVQIDEQAPTSRCFIVFDR